MHICINIKKDEILSQKSHFHGFVSCLLMTRKIDKYLNEYYSTLIYYEIRITKLICHKIWIILLIYITLCIWHFFRGRRVKSCSLASGHRKELFSLSFFVMFPFQWKYIWFWFVFKQKKRRKFFLQYIAYKTFKNTWLKKATFTIYILVDISTVCFL